MDEQAPAGSYPDHEGNMSHIDGAASTELVRSPGGDETTAVNLSSKKDGAFSKLGAVVKKAAADRQTAKEELGRKHAADAEAAGALVTSGVFGASTIEIYQGGYVRVAAGLSNATQPASIAKNTPYEKLRSIKFTQPGQDQASGTTSGLEGALGPALTGLMKGGKAFMKGSVPGLAVAGITHLVTNEGRKPFLTIVTDKEIHTLVNQISNGVFNKSTKGHNEVGLVLEAAGNSVLGAVEGAAQVPASESQPVAVSHVAKAPTLAERLRELADLHRDGILSDDEFAAAKGKLLAGL